MKFQIGFVKYIRKPKRIRLQVSPQEKFNRIARRLKSKGKNAQLRKFHFNAIEAGKTLIVFDGEGIEAIQVENSIKGCAVARQHCLSIFFNSDNQNGGFSFTNPNFEHQTLEELKAMHEIALRQTNTVIHCESCRFRFDSVVERNLHICNDNKTKGWAIFEFTKLKRIYAGAIN